MSRPRRFDSQIAVLLHALTGTGWQTLAQLRALTGICETSISAQLRNLRKEQHGGHVIEKRRLNGGEWEYSLND